MGAAGVCVGTHLIATIEANAHQEYKRRVLQATEKDIARTCIFGPEWPDAQMRVLRNRVVRAWEGNDTKTPVQPNPAVRIGKTVLGGIEYVMPKFAATLLIPEASGDFEEMCLAAGESAALVSEITTAQEVVQSMGKQAQQILTPLGTSAALLSKS